MGCSLSGLCTKQAPLYNQTEKSFHRIVLMGTGDSGKTTFLKQMRNTYQHGYPASERLKSKPCVFQNIITAVQIILEWSGRLKSKYSIDGCLTDCCNESVKKALLELSQTASLNEDVQTYFLVVK